LFLVIGLAISGAVFVICLLVVGVAASRMSATEMNQSGLKLYFGWAALMLLLPSLAAGYAAGHSGLAYGALLSAIPILLWPFVVHGFPIVWYVGWVALGAIGGYLGQLLRTNRAKRE
jgi:hypothetical protein